MTEWGSGGLANSLPRPSKCSWAEAGQGSPGLVFRFVPQVRETSVHDTGGCGRPTGPPQSRALSSGTWKRSELITGTTPQRETRGGPHEIRYR